MFFFHLQVLLSVPVTVVARVNGPSRPEKSGTGKQISISVTAGGHAEFESGSSGRIDSEGNDSDPASPESGAVSFLELG